MTSNRRIRLDLRRRCTALVSLSALALLSGCSVHGKWSLARVDPDAARRDFEFACLTLQRDGTFYAEAREAGGIDTTSGTYTCQDGLLVLRAHDGETDTYESRLAPGGETLELTRHWRDSRVVAYLEREE
jgi:hypothetical protein